MGIDIFSQGTKAEMRWWSPVNIGDKVQGTYVDKFEAIDQWNNEQFVYVLKQEDGSLTKYGVKKYKTSLIQQMDSIKFGQIIGFIFSKTIPPKSGRGNNDIKIIDVIHNPNIIDHEWIAAQRALDGVKPANTAGLDAQVDDRELQAASDDIAITGTPATIFGETPEVTPATPASNEVSAADKVKEIIALAGEKLGANDPSTIKDKVMEVTGIPFIEANLDSIIAKLKTL